MFKNYQLADVSQLNFQMTSSSSLVAPNVRVAIDPGKGDIEMKTEDHLSLAFVTSTPKPNWIEFAISLLDQPWRECRQMLLRYRASGDKLKISPALRFCREDGFHDHFAKQTHVLTPDIEEFHTEFSMPPRWCREATSLEMILFFSPMSGQFDLFELAITGID